jgi:predicted N-formylglutamate amidohydrolase
VNLLVTCEHGGNEVPREYRRLFRGAGRVLESQRGWDPGALELAGRMADALDAPLVAGTVSRLVVDLNRSLTNPAVWSEWTRGLSEAEREPLVSAYYTPYREIVERRVHGLTARGPLLHVAVHSFTPVLRGVRRDADIGLLYDPSRRAEREVSAAWRDALRVSAPRLRVRMNYPYRGTSDGLTTSLRRLFPPSAYAGVELEVNQRIVRGREWRSVQSATIRSLQVAMEERHQGMRRRQG